MVSKAIKSMKQYMAGVMLGILLNPSKEGYLKGLMGEEGFFNYFASLPKTRLERIVELVNNLVEKD